MKKLFALTLLFITAAAAIPQVAHAETTTKKISLTDKISVDFRANRLEDVYKHLSILTGMDFVVNWKALEDGGITKDTPITLKLNRVSFQKILIKVMQLCEANGARMGTYVEKTFIEVSTREQLTKKKVIRVYNIATLVMKIPDYDKPPKFDLQGAMAQAQQNGGGGSIWQQGGDEEVKSEAELMEEVADLIRALIEPDIWAANGGTEGVIKIHGKNLVISAPMHIQKDIKTYWGSYKMRKAIKK